MLQIDSLSFSYEEPIFQDVSFSLGVGEIIGIVGQSGAGKTTLLKVIAGILEPSSGQVSLEQEIVRGPAYNLVPGHPEIKLVDQDFALDLHHTVRENIREKVLYLPLPAREELIDELLDLIELQHLAAQKAILLSGGEQQRLALARALAGEPKVILLDEPFAHLDGRLRQKIASYLVQMREIRGTSFLLVSHDGEEILSLADRIIHFSKGALVRMDIPEAFYFLPNNYEEAELFGRVNKVSLQGESVLFRPTEFELPCRPSSMWDPLENLIVVTFLGARFAGSHYINYFRTDQNEKIILYHQTALKNEKEIIISKRSTPLILA
jgi:iron(III) transport system ATP-binding protein